MGQMEKSNVFTTWTCLRVAIIFGFNATLYNFYPCWGCCYDWLVVYLPLWKIWVRQWEERHPIYYGKWKMFETTNQMIYPLLVYYIYIIYIYYIVYIIYYILYIKYYILYTVYYILYIIYCILYIIYYILYIIYYILYIIYYILYIIYHILYIIYYILYIIYHILYIILCIIYIYLYIYIYTYIYLCKDLPWMSIMSDREGPGFLSHHQKKSASLLHRIGSPFCLGKIWEGRALCRPRRPSKRLWEPHGLRVFFVFLGYPNFTQHLSRERVW